MIRTKWLRLGVKDAADILRWAAAQNAGGLDDFRHRVIRGREFVSFRLVPRYRVEIGTSDIVVVAHVQPTIRQRLFASMAFLRRSAGRRVAATIAALKPRTAPRRCRARSSIRWPRCASRCRHPASGCGYRLVLNMF